MSNITEEEIKQIIAEELEQVLLEKCWPGYEKKGMKKMFGKMYPNCVKKSKKKKRKKKRKNENVDLYEADPKKGTGKKPKGSGRRLYTDEDPSDTVSVKFSTVQDIKDTLSKASFKSKSHKRQSQIINLIHQRVRAALNKAKDPAVKKRLRSGFEYIKKRKEASKKKTQRMRKNKNESI